MIVSSIIIIIIIVIIVILIEHCNLIVMRGEEGAQGAAAGLTCAQYIIRQHFSSSSVVVIIVTIANIVIVNVMCQHFSSSFKVNRRDHIQLLCWKRQVPPGRGAGKVLHPLGHRRGFFWENPLRYLHAKVWPEEIWVLGISFSESWEAHFAQVHRWESHRFHLAVGNINKNSWTMLLWSWWI